MGQSEGRFNGQGFAFWATVRNGPIGRAFQWPGLCDFLTPTRNGPIGGTFQWPRFAFWATARNGPIGRTFQWPAFCVFVPDCDVDNRVLKCRSTTSTWDLSKLKCLATERTSLAIETSF